MLLAPKPRELCADRSPERPDATAIFKAHHGFVWRVLRHLGVAAADQEDAMQEVFVVVHRRLPEYREQDKMRAWLYAICARVARDQRRRVGRRREQLTEDIPHDVDATTPANHIAQRQALQFAERLLATLPEKQRIIFLLYEVEQMSMTDIASAVGCPVPTAYSRLHKARERMLALVTRAQLTGEVP